MKNPFKIRSEMAIKKLVFLLLLIVFVPFLRLETHVFYNWFQKRKGHPQIQRPARALVSACEDARGRVRLCVRDDGIGLPAQMNWEQSSSLGLGIVKTLARQLRAEVRVRNAQGTEFTLQFER